MTEKLLPCPFCGGNHVTVAQCDPSDGHEVYCKQCRGAMWSGAPESAAELWNTRTPGPATAKLIRCIKADLEPTDKMLEAFIAEWQGGDV